MSGPQISETEALARIVKATEETLRATRGIQILLTVFIIISIVIGFTG